VGFVKIKPERLTTANCWFADPSEESAEFDGGLGDGCTRTSLPQDGAGECHVTSDGCAGDASTGRSDSTASCRTCSSAPNEGLRCGTEPGPGDGAMLAGLDRGDATATNDGVEGAAGDVPLPPG